VKSRSWIAKLLAGLLVVALLPGCAYWDKPDPPPFERMKLEGEAQYDEEGRLEGDLQPHTTLKGAVVGGGTGAVTLGTAGTIAAVVSCSPTALFYPLCLAVGIAILGGGGLVIGAVGGAVVGGVTGLPAETKDRVEVILRDLEASRQFAEEVLVALQEAVPEEKQFEPLEDVMPGMQPREGLTATAIRPDAIVVASLDEVKLRQHTKDRLSIRMWSSMDMRWDLEAEEATVRTCEYEWTSETADVEDWLVDDGKRFHDAFSEGIRQIAEWMARDLEAFATRTELRGDDDTPPSCYQE
jgi:hypothetical protein